MLLSDDESRLESVRELLKSATDLPESQRGRTELHQTDLQLIVPAGWGAAYALDPEGFVVGFKFGSPSFPQQLIELILGFPKLQRLVFHTRQDGLTCPRKTQPARIGDLTSRQ